MSQSTINFQQTPKKVRHILSLSGGKDSTALAVYLRDKLPNLEYVFCDTGEELYEKIDPTTGEGYTWIQRESLPQLIRPERIAAIKGEYERRKKRKAAFRRNDSLWNVFALNADENRDGCLICHL